MRICSIASGSSGNCIYIGHENHHILLDAGVSRKRIVDGLKELGVSPEMLDGIFVTHEHTDHICGIPMMEKMFHTPVYATGGTLDAICSKDKKGDISLKNLYQLYADEPVQVGGFQITPFTISHDAAEPVCYTIECAGKKIGVVSDLGYYDSYIVEHLSGSDVLMMEANHDISMLEAGPYPYSLKCRILGEQGHLSNEMSGKLLCDLYHKGLKEVFLTHLSKENNYPQLAYESVKCQLWEEMGWTELPFTLEVAKRDVPSRVVHI